MEHVPLPDDLRARAGDASRPSSTAGSSRALAATIAIVTERLDAFDATTAGRAIGELVDDLSNWYLRRSRRRFWEGESAAFDTLETCL